MLRTPFFLMLIFSCAFAQDLRTPVALVRTETESGAGFIVGERDGQLYLITAAHVIEDGTDILLSFRGNYEAQATIINSDAGSDVAVISCPRPVGFVPQVFPTASGGVSDGQSVVVIGHPLGNDWDVNKINQIKESTYGILSGRFTIYPAGIGPGSSGGPVLNEQGQLLGLVTEVDLVKTVCMQVDVLLRACREWDVPVNIETVSPNEPGTYTDPMVGKMVLVSGGAFTMGSNEEERAKPPHRVTVKDFYIGAYEVTQAQWRAVMKSNPPKLNFPGCDKCPVENVSWKDIQAFIFQLNIQTGQQYRLPTEAEWEYAAGGGAGSRTAFAGTNSLGNLGEYAWYFDNAENKTHPVGQKKPNGLGLYDMIGNVFEFCEDDWHPNYQGAPKDGRAWVGNSSGSGRVCRGGGWIDRTENKPNAFRVVSRSFGSSAILHGGFRLAR